MPLKMDTFTQVCHPTACQPAPCKHGGRGACPNWQLLSLIITCTLCDELFCISSWSESHPHQLDITVSIVNNNLQMEYSRSWKPHKMQPNETNMFHGYNDTVGPQAYVFMFQMTSISQPLVLSFNQEWKDLQLWKQYTTTSQTLWEHIFM